MEIKVTLEDRELFDIAVQHLAEQTEMGDVEEWVWNLVLREITAQPWFRTCPECHADFYPVFQTREIHTAQKKFYRLDVARMIEVCTKCGCATVPDSAIEREPCELNAELNRRFLAGVDRDELFKSLPA